MRRLVDQDPIREQRRQSLLLDRLEVQYRNGLSAEIGRAMHEILQAFEQTGEIAPARDHRERMESLYRQMYEGAFRVFGMRIIEQGKSAGLGFEMKESFLDIFFRAALQFVGQELVRRRITQVVETTREQIVRQVNRAFSDSLGVSEAARLIRDNVRPIAMQRAGVIARTELHGAANAGADTAARATGLQLRKEWVPVDDTRTRSILLDDAFDHRQMKGQIVGMDEPFLMPWAFGGPVPCQFPGDPALPAGGAINCRCAVSHIVIE